MPASDWTKDISCGRCGRKDWHLRGGSWRCSECERAMTMADVAAAHRQGSVPLSRPERRRGSAGGGATASMNGVVTLKGEVPPAARRPTLHDPRQTLGCDTAAGEAGTGTPWPASDQLIGPPLLSSGAARSHSRRKSSSRDCGRQPPSGANAARRAVAENQARALSA